MDEKNFNLTQTGQQVQDILNSAKSTDQVLTEIQEAMENLPDGQAVSAQVALNTSAIQELDANKASKTEVENDYAKKTECVFDISAYHATGTPPVLETYADLAAALGTDGANIPEELRNGGMSVKFVQSSDNKYVKFFCTAQNFTTDVTQWQSLNADDEPTAGSDNLVKSGGVYHLSVDINGGLEETVIESEYSYGLLYTAGTIGPTSNHTYQHSAMLPLNDEVVKIKCYCSNATDIGSIVFYKYSTFPANSTQASQYTVEAISNVPTGNTNAVLEVNSEKLDSLRSRGAKYFAICVLTDDTKGISTFTPAEGLKSKVENLEIEVTTLDGEIDRIDKRIEGGTEETVIESEYSDGYISAGGVIGGTSSPTYQHTEPIALTEDMDELKCYAWLADSYGYGGGVGFYNSMSLPTVSSQAERTVEVIGIGTGSSQGNNELLTISAEKIAELKSRGAICFSVCIISAGSNTGISYIKHTDGIVEEISGLNERCDGIEEGLDVVKNGIVTESQEPDSNFEYGYISGGVFGGSSQQTYSCSSSLIPIADIIGIRAMATLNNSDAGGVYFYSSSLKPTSQSALTNYVGQIGCGTTQTSGYVNEEIIITREQILQMKELGAKYFAISSYTEGRALYISRDQEDGLLQIKEDISAIEGSLEEIVPFVRKRMDIALADTPDEILQKLITVYDGSNYDVYWECGTYDMSNAWLTMSTMARFTYINTYELPIGGKNNRYYFHGSTITASGLYDLIGAAKASNSNLFGTLRTGNHSYELYDATFIISDGNYVFHDETSAALGSQRHIYTNIRLINEPTEHSGSIHTCLGLGTGYNMTLIFRNCLFNNTDGEACVRSHGINTPVEGEISNSRFIFDGNYFFNGIELGNVAIRENIELVFCGNSYTTLTISRNGQGVYTEYKYCNEQRT